MDRRGSADAEQLRCARIRSTGRSAERSKGGAGSRRLTAEDMSGAERPGGLIPRDGPHGFKKRKADHAATPGVTAKSLVSVDV